MNRFLCTLIGLFFLVSLAVASESSSAKLDLSLLRAVEGGDVEECEKLITQYVALLHNLGREDSRLLLIASQIGHGEIVQLLLENKAKVNAAYANGATPLFMASQGGHVEVVQLLLGSKAHAGTAAKNGATPLFVACENDHVEAVRLLLESKAQANVGMKDGSTPLHMACHKGHVAVVQLLLDSEAAINTKTSLETTALHFAVDMGHIDCAALLLEAKADVNLLDGQGNTPLVYAAEKENRELCILLSRYGAEIKLSRWSLNLRRKELIRYVRSVLASDGGVANSTDQGYSNDPQNAVDYICEKSISILSSIVGFLEELGPQKE